LEDYLKEIKEKVRSLCGEHIWCWLTITHTQV